MVQRDAEDSCFVRLLVLLVPHHERVVAERPPPPSLDEPGSSSGAPSEGTHEAQPGLQTYQLRHGGASDDCEQGERVHAAGSLEDGHLGEAVRQGGNIQSLLNQLLKWALQHCKQAVSKMPDVILGRMGAIILEMFAGVGRLTNAFRKWGITCYAIDISLNAGDNVLHVARHTLHNFQFG